MRPDLELLRNLIDTTPEIAPRPGAGKSAAEVRAAESVVGPLSPSYRWWLAEYGEGTVARQEIATVGALRHIGGPDIAGRRPEGDRLPFHQDGDCGDRYSFALDAAGADGEHPVVRHDPFTGEDEPFADSFAGFLTVRTALLRGLREGPNPAVARLWRATPGVRLRDGGQVYGPQALGVRNEARGIADRAPHWVLIGEDGTGGGLFMRRHGRDRTSVHRLALEAVTAAEPRPEPRAEAGSGSGTGALEAAAGDVAAIGERLTDDLLGWIRGVRTPAGAGEPPAPGWTGRAGPTG
ncbi:SMI1/KNR4 family protein [Streptomyces sp. NPDC006798]|uniref:SMI1/KNR4 family protein n=1 Tax=Streptomyces sp. NPDC006798 TaxID=3155462 RepID=UPI0033F6B3DB